VRVHARETAGGWSPTLVKTVLCQGLGTSSRDGRRRLRGAANQPLEAKQRGGKNQAVTRVNARMLAQQEALAQRPEQPVVASTGRFTRAPAWLAADR
jgi:hypothetical protein